MSDAVYIVDGVRTPFAKAGTHFADVPADDLGRAAAAALLARTGIDPVAIDEVIFGCVGQPVEATNIARIIALRAGVPESVPAVTVQRNCASGLEAVAQAAQRIAAGLGDLFLVGGTENMSLYPLLFSRQAARKFGTLGRARRVGERLAAIARFRPRDFRPRVSLMLGLTDAACGISMGQTAENLAHDWAISRAEQDEFALRSHQRAVAARERLREEITPFVSPSTDGEARCVEDDNGPREAQSIDALAKLRPVFDRHHGSVTAGNASQVTDGAVALLVASERAVRAHDLRPIGRLVATASAGCEPARMGLGAIHAIARVGSRAGLQLGDADLIEINEAFAAQVLACRRAAASAEYARQHFDRTTPLGEIPEEKLNVNGGAIALGHPVGSSGARLVLSALRELRRRRARRAVVALCVSGGQGGACWLEAA